MFTSYLHGASVGRSKIIAAPPTKRSGCSGWSTGAALRNMRFLQSIPEESLAGLVGYGFSFTIRDCPTDPQSFARAVDRLCVNLRRGHRFYPAAELVHWVIEWQRRGVPHLHGIIWCKPHGQDMAYNLTGAWLQACMGQWGASIHGQSVKRLYDVKGWSDYLSKHASRGANHYQRSRASLPIAWSRKTGRMWGKRGVWIVVPPRQFVALIVGSPSHAAALAGDEVRGDPADQDRRALWAERRLIRSWSVSKARQQVNVVRRSVDPLPLRRALRHLTFVRSMLRCSDVEVSPHRSTSLWIPQPVIEKFVENLRSRGFFYIERAPAVPTARAGVQQAVALAASLGP